MATLGYTTVATGTVGLWTANNLAAAGPYTASEDGTIDSVSLYTGNANPVTLGVYQDNGSGAPGALIGDSAGGTATAGGWTTQAVSGSITAGTAYWIGWNFGTQTNVRYDASVTSKRVRFAASAYSAGTLPNPFTTAGQDVRNDRDYSAYLTYTPTGGTPSIEITAPATKQCYQRNGSNQASITVTGTTLNVSDGEAVEGRFNGGTWASLGTVSSGAFSGTLSGQAAGQGTLEVRLTADTGTTDSVADITIGDGFLIAGQSNAEGQGVNNQTYTHGSWKLFSYRSSGGWFQGDPTDSSGAGSAWPLLATEISHASGEAVPVWFVTCGVNGSTILTEWATDGSGTAYNSCVSQVEASAVNGLAGLIWYEGETAALNGLAKATHKAALSNLLDAFQAEGGAFTGLKMFCVQLAMFNRDGSEPTAAQLDAIRQSQAESWDDDADIYPGAVLHDLNLTADGLHLTTDAHLAALAGRSYLAIEGALYGGSNSRGPRFSSATYSDDTITLTFDKDLDTGDTNYTSSAFAVTDNGSGATISSVTRTGTRTVDIVCSATLTGPVTVTGGSGNSGAGATIPKTADITLPSGVTVKQPFEPFIGETATLAGLQAGTLSETSQTNSSVTVSWTAASNNTGTVTDQLQRSDDGTTGWTNVSGATSSPATVNEMPIYLRVAYTDDVETVYSDVLEVTDQTDPQVTSLRITGDILRVVFSEAVSGDLSQLALTASGGALTITGDDTLTAQSSIDVQVSRTPATDETITATLSEPSGITDAATNVTAGFTDEPVTIGGGGFDSDGTVYTDAVFSPLVFTRDIYPEGVFD